MKKSTKLIHAIIKLLCLDDLVSQFSPKIPYLYKFLPTHNEYIKGTIKRIRYSNINFELEVSDYMQWYIYANIKEPLWEISYGKIKQGSTILDVGANVGAYSLQCASNIWKRKINAKIIAFEPNPKIFKNLRNNISINKHLEKYIRIEKIALSEKTGKGNFIVSEYNSGSGHLISEKVGIPVNTSTVDQYTMTSNITNISVIKIDVEGSEPLVIKGALNTIKDFRPILLIEMTDSWFKSIGYSEIEIRKQIKDMGYHLFSSEKNELIQITNSKRKFLNQYNLLALPD